MKRWVAILLAAAAMTTTALAGTAEAKKASAEKLRRYMITELRARGSNVPPALSADAHWHR